MNRHKVFNVYLLILNLYLIFWKWILWQNWQKLWPRISISRLSNLTIYICLYRVDVRLVLIQHVKVKRKIHMNTHWLSACFRVLCLFCNTKLLKCTISWQTDDRSCWFYSIHSIHNHSIEREWIHSIISYDGIKKSLVSDTSVDSVENHHQSGDQNCLQIVKNCKLFEQTRRSTTPCWKVGTISLNVGT